MPARGLERFGGATAKGKCFFAWGTGYDLSTKVSARLGLDYRAVGIRRGNGIFWFWIGSHADYDALLRQL